MKSKQNLPSSDLRICTLEPTLEPLATAISELSLDPANLRIHEPRSIDALKSSLRRFGQQKPIVVDGRKVVIAGNGTLEAARQLGWTHIAVVRSSLSEVERVLYAIADNRTHELSKWDLGALGATLNALSSEDLPDTGFSLKDFDELHQGASISQTTVTEIESPEIAGVAVSKLGDLWLMGAHRLLCGSCTVADDIKRVMQGERAMLFATDPPYLVSYDGTNHPQTFKGGSKDWSSTYGNNWDDADENSELYDKFIGAAVAHAIDPYAAWYCWHASRRQAFLEAAWIKHGAFVHSQIIWAKNRPVLTRTLFMWQHEPCFMGWIKGNMPHITKAARSSTVWSIDTIPNGDERPDHPTPKPLETFAIPMRQHLTKGGLCYEPFSGSGTQIIVAEQLGTRCFALEIEPRYVDVAIKRWEKQTGQRAILDGDGRDFVAIAAARSRAAENTQCPPAQVDPAPTPDAEHSSKVDGPVANTDHPIVRKPGPARKAPPRSAVTAVRGKS